MANKLVRQFAGEGYDTAFNSRYRDMGGGVWAQEVALAPDLALGAKSLTLTLADGAGSVPIPDGSRIVRVMPVSSTAVRVGLEAPEANGTATGNAVAADLKKGVPVLAAVWTDFYIEVGASRTLYVLGGAADVVQVAVL